MTSPTPKKRLLSLDALRGFDMFWIIGGEEIFHLLAKTTSWPWVVAVSYQLNHPDWNGFRAYDLIFPLFLFMAGVSTPYSLANKHNTDRNVLVRKIVQRGLTLVLLGIIYNNGLELKPIAEMRFASVLARIGLAGMFAQLLYVYTNTRTQYYIFGGILISYWLFVMLVPVPGCGAGLMTIDCNPVSYIDKNILPGLLHKTIHDPEGLVSTLPAICTALLGIFAGNILKSETAETQKIKQLLNIGALCLVVGYVWDFAFPINKNLWTSSFVLWVGGLSMLLLAVFYWLIDYKGYNRYAWVFSVIGTNSILIYLASHFIDFDKTTEALFGGIFKYFTQPTQHILHAVGFVLVEWLFLYFLYKKKVFLKV